MDRSKLGKRSRLKGKQQERLLGHLLGKWWFNDERALRPRALSGGWNASSAGDLVVDDTIADPNKFPFFVESKHDKSMLVNGAILAILHGDLGKLKSLWWDTHTKAQAVNKIALLSIKGDRTPTYIFMMRGTFDYIFGISGAPHKTEYCEIRTMINTHLFNIVIMRLEDFILLSPSKEDCHDGSMG